MFVSDAFVPPRARTGEAPCHCAFGRLRGPYKPILLRRIQLEREVSDREPGQLFDIAQVSALLVTAQRDRYAARTGARRSADAVNIIFRNVGQLEVDNVRYALHVDPARGDVGSDEDSGAAGAKAGECAFALRLRLVAVDRDGLDAGAVQMPHDPVGTMLGAGEHEHPVERGILQQSRKRLPLPIARDEDDALIHQLHRRRWRRDGHLEGIVEVRFGQRRDGSRHGRREQQGLPLPRQQRHDPPQGVNKAEIEHSIGLVQNQDLDAR